MQGQRQPKNRPFQARGVRFNLATLPQNVVFVMLRVKRKGRAARKTQKSCYSSRCETADYVPSDRERPTKAPKVLEDLLVRYC